MELRQLRYLISVADHRGFRAAAIAMGASQSAVSRAVQRLEDEVGVTLVLRQPGRSAMLTPSGERMVEAARRALADISDAAASVRRIGTGKAGSLRIGTTGQVTERGRALFRRFSDVHRDFALLFEAGVPTEICRSVSAGALDVYFGIDVLISSELVTLALWRETISLIVPETHPLAERDSVGVDDFADETLVVVGSPGTDYSSLIRQQFGRPIRFRVAAGTFQNTLLDALFGQGVVVAPSGNTEELPSGLAAVRIGDLGMPLQRVLAWLPANENPSLGILLAHVRDSLDPA